jgi:hypothetical protein
MRAGRKGWPLVTLIIALAVVLVAGYVLTRGMRAGVNLTSRNSGANEYVGVQCFYLHWDGIHRRDIDLTNKTVNPNTNSYCPFLENSD